MRLRRSNLFNIRVSAACHPDQSRTDAADPLRSASYILQAILAANNLLLLSTLRHAHAILLNLW